MSTKKLLPYYFLVFLFYTLQFLANAQACFNQSNSLDLNGFNGRLRIANNVSQNLLQLTMEVWVRPTALNSNRYIMSRGGGSCEPEGRYSLRLTPTGHVEFVYSQNSGYSPVYRSADAIPLNQWTHLALTYNYTTYAITMYINGKPVSGSWVTPPNSNTYNFTTTSDLTVGARAAVTSSCNSSPASAHSDFFTGQIDEEIGRAHV